MSATMTASASARSVSLTVRATRPNLSMSAELARIRSEYLEMPGLVLTLPQAARLWGISTGRAAELLTMLLDAGFLACDRETAYRRQR
jgi:hypothetical protein